MLDRRLVAGGAAVALVAVAMVAFVLLSPRWAVGTLDQLAQQHLGRSVSAKGRAQLDFSPLAIRIGDAALSGGGRGEDSFVTTPAWRLAQFTATEPTITLDEVNAAFRKMWRRTTSDSRKPFARAVRAKSSPLNSHIVVSVNRTSRPSSTIASASAGNAR